MKLVGWLENLSVSRRLFQFPEESFEQCEEHQEPLTLVCTQCNNRPICEKCSQHSGHFVEQSAESQLACEYEKKIKEKEAKIQEILSFYDSVLGRLHWSMQADIRDIEATYEDHFAQIRSARERSRDAAGSYKLVCIIFLQQCSRFHCPVGHLKHSGAF